MGFKFGYTKFTVGVVEIEVQNIDTEKYKGTISLTIPTKFGNFDIVLYSGTNWSEVRSMSAKVGFTQTEPNPIPEDDYTEGDESNEEESTS